MLGGEVSKDTVGARSAEVYKLLIDLAFAADGHPAKLCGHWACAGVTALFIKKCSWPIEKVYSSVAVLAAKRFTKKLFVIKIDRKTIQNVLDGVRHC